MRAVGLSPVQFTFAIVAAAALAVALLLMGSSNSADAATVDDSFNVTYDASVADTTPGAARELTTIFSVPNPGNINFGNLITFDPAGSLTQSCNLDTNSDGYADAYDGNGDGDAADGGRESEACMDAGDTVGTLQSTTTLGTLNSLCFTTFLIDFDFFAVPLPNDVTDPDSSTNIAYTQPEGTSDRFERWGTTPAVGTDIAVGGGSVVTLSGTQAVADNIMFKNYPQYLLDLFRTAGGTPILPRAVYGALTFVAGSTHVPLYFAIFDEGDLAGAGYNSNNPLSQADADQGFASQTVLNDPTQSSANPSSISAFCSTTSTTVLDASSTDGPDNGSGTDTRATNPASAGTYLNLAWAASQRDLDNDGIENALDTCVLLPNTDGDPRAAGADPDGDMLDSVCDPSPGSNDGDQFSDTGWFNTQDNCPLISNPSQASSEISAGVDGSYAAGAADDGGPLGDGIGDACDTGTASPTYNGITYDGAGGNPPSLTLSSTVANGRWAVRALVVPICHGGTDSDGDGYCAGDADTGFDGNAVRHSAWTLTSALSSVLGTTSTAGSGSWDTDGGNGAGLAFDSDYLETYLGIDARQPCSLTSTGLSGGSPDEPLGAWIFDYNTDQVADFGDILPIAPVFLSEATTPLALRFDWNADGFVDFGDVLGIAPAFLDPCTPIVQPQ